MSFDYQAEPVRTSRTAVIALAVTGVVLAIVCAVWVFWPMVTDASRQSTTGTITSYSAGFVPSFGATLHFRPTITYKVSGREHTFTSDTSVTAPDTRSMPPGSITTVRYAPADPSDAVWAPGGIAVALNWIGVTGLVLGIMLVAVAIMLRALNGVRDRRRSTEDLT